MENEDLQRLRRWVLINRRFDRWNNRYDMSILLLLIFQSVTLLLNVDAMSLGSMKMNMLAAITSNMSIKLVFLQLTFLCIDNPFISSKIDILMFCAGLRRL